LPFSLIRYGAMKREIPTLTVAHTKVDIER